MQHHLMTKLSRRRLGSRIINFAIRGTFRVEIKNDKLKEERRETHLNEGPPNRKLRRSRVTFFIKGTTNSPHRSSGSVWCNGASWFTSRRDVLEQSQVGSCTPIVHCMKRILDTVGSQCTSSRIDAVIGLYFCFRAAIRAAPCWTDCSYLRRRVERCCSNLVCC